MRTFSPYWWIRRANEGCRPNFREIFYLDKYGRQQDAIEVSEIALPRLLPPAQIRDLPV
jgi:hypothetical protein